MRKNVGRSLMVEDLRREQNRTPVPLRRSVGAQPFVKNTSKMLNSKSLQKIDTVSNISRMDIERQNEFNEALRKKLSYEWKNIYRSLLQSDVLQKGSISVQKFNQVCVNHGMILSKEEIRRLVKLG